MVRTMLAVRGNLHAEPAVRGDLHAEQAVRGNLHASAASSSTDVMQTTSQTTALIIEDSREAEVELKKRGLDCERITHNELMTSTGTGYTGKLMFSPATRQF